MSLQDWVKADWLKLSLRDDLPVGWVFLEKPDGTLVPVMALKPKAESSPPAPAHNRR